MRLLSRCLSLLLLHSLLLLAALARALPAGRRAIAGDVVRRKEDVLADSVTVHTSQTSNTSLGPMVEACVIKMTPITLHDGHRAVEMVKNCTLSLVTPVNAGNGSAVTLPPLNPPSTTTTIAASSPPTKSSNPSTSTTSYPDPSTSMPPAADPPPPQAPTPADPPTPAVSSGQKKPSDPSSSASAAGSLESQSGGVTIPGKKLSVLPIGLGVFAGISIIALIIVGLVTYERTRYRKLFRKRKLAEQLNFIR